MELVLLTALGVGSATIFGSIIGFLFKKQSHKFSDIVLSFAAGVMLAAAVIGLLWWELDPSRAFWIVLAISLLLVAIFSVVLVKSTASIKIRTPKQIKKKRFVRCNYYR